jgi:hypothetical protein
LKPLTWAPVQQQQQQQPTDAAADADSTPAAPTVTPSDTAAAAAAAGDISSAATSADGQQQQQVLTEALLILKYGGVLTHAGRAQAEELGKIFRLVMYPNYGSTGGGLLRLHSTYRHDFKIYSSDEGRVQVMVITA